MRILRLFGFGSKAILAENHAVQGVVIDVKKCWWIKVNTKPVRAHLFDGALFPHIITYRYAVSGQEYTGKRFIGVYTRCPQQGERIPVYYSEENPDKSTIRV